MAVLQPIKRFFGSADVDKIPSRSPRRPFSHILHCACPLPPVQGFKHGDRRQDFFMQSGHLLIFNQDTLEGFTVRKSSRKFPVKLSKS